MIRVALALLALLALCAVLLVAALPASAACVHMDLDGSGSVDIGDWSALLGAALGVAPCEPCDVVPDGVVDVVDAQVWLLGAPGCLGPIQCVEHVWTWTAPDQLDYLWIEGYQVALTGVVVPLDGGPMLAAFTLAYSADPLSPLLAVGEVYVWTEGVSVEVVWTEPGKGPGLTDWAVVVGCVGVD